MVPFPSLEGAFPEWRGGEGSHPSDGGGAPSGGGEASTKDASDGSTGDGGAEAPQPPEDAALLAADEALSPEDAALSPEDAAQPWPTTGSSGRERSRPTRLLCRARCHRRHFEHQRPALWLQLSRVRAPLLTPEIPLNFLLESGAWPIFWASLGQKSGPGRRGRGDRLSGEQDDAGGCDGRTWPAWRAAWRGGPSGAARGGAAGRGAAGRRGTVAGIARDAAGRLLAPIPRWEGRPSAAPSEEIQAGSAQADAALAGVPSSTIGSKPP